MSGLARLGTISRCLCIANSKEICIIFLCWVFAAVMLSRKNLCKIYVGFCLVAEIGISMANKTSALLVSRKQKMNRTGNRHRIMKRNVLREFKTSNKKVYFKGYPRAQTEGAIYISTNQYGTSSWFVNYESYFKSNKRNTICTNVYSISLLT